MQLPPIGPTTGFGSAGFVGRFERAKPLRPSHLRPSGNESAGRPVHNLNRAEWEVFLAVVRTSRRGLRVAEVADDSHL